MVGVCFAGPPIVSFNKSQEENGVTQTVVALQSDVGHSSFLIFPNQGFEGQRIGLFRHNLLWVAPVLVDYLSQLPLQVHIVICKTLSHGLLIISPLADSAFNSLTTISGDKECELDSCRIRIDQMLPTEPSRAGARILLITEVPPVMSLGAAMMCNAEKICELLGTCMTRPLKEQHIRNSSTNWMLQKWGWCSWDAYDTRVTASLVISAAKTLECPWMLIDDGWLAIAPFTPSSPSSSTSQQSFSSFDDGSPYFDPSASLSSASATESSSHSSIEFEDRNLPTPPPLSLSQPRSLSPPLHYPSPTSNLKGVQFSNSPLQLCLDALHGSIVRGFDVLAQVVDELKAIRTDMKIAVWHTAIGYWAGVTQRFADQCGVRTLEFSSIEIPPEIRTNWGCLNAIKWQGPKRIVHPDDVEKFFSLWFKYLASAGIDGCKIDSQCILECVQSAEMSSTLIVQQYKKSMISAASTRFSKLSEEALGPDAIPILHCMCCGLHTIHNSFLQYLTRTSEDHLFPNCSEDALQVANHIWSNAVAGEWLGTFFRCDWDMFRTGEWHADIHAVARAVSGGPIYVSDRPDRFNRMKLTPLLMPDGSGRIIRCEGVGRACSDSLFVNPLTTPTGYKVWNYTDAGWMVVVFGLYQSSGTILNALVFPSDVEHADQRSSAEPVRSTLVCWNVTSNHTDWLTMQDGWNISVQYMHAVVLAWVLPIPIIPIDSTSSVHVACFGLEGVHNPSGTFSDKPVKCLLRLEEATVYQAVLVRMESAGRLRIWVDRASSSIGICEAATLEVGGTTFEIVEVDDEGVATTVIDDISSHLVAQKSQLQWFASRGQAHSIDVCENVLYALVIG
jgi:hypothetical protein